MGRRVRVLAPHLYRYTLGQVIHSMHREEEGWIHVASLQTKIIADQYEEDFNRCASASQEVLLDSKRVMRRRWMAYREFRKQRINTSKGEG
jgi:hypothetical protein